MTPERRAELRNIYYDRHMAPITSAELFTLLDALDAAEAELAEARQPMTWQQDDDFLALYVAPFDPVFGPDVRLTCWQRVATADDVRKALEGGGDE